MLTAIVSLIAYAHVVEGGASVSRATLMAVVYFAGRAIDLRGPPANTLAVAAALLVAAQPLAIVDPSFLLTFGATAAHSRRHRDALHPPEASRVRGRPPRFLPRRSPPRPP